MDLINVQVCILGARELNVRLDSVEFGFILMEYCGGDKTLRLFYVFIVCNNDIGYSVQRPKLAEHRTLLYFVPLVLLLMLAMDK